jgi:predicted acetyltransferase
MKTITEDGDYTFHHLETEEDIEQDLDLVKVAFADDEAYHIVRRLIDHHPYMGLKDHFTMRWKGRVVASLNLIPQTWSVGGVSLKVAEMGCVATHPEHRRRGLQRRLADEYHRRLLDDGYDLSVIEGIPYFYRQFGYEYAIPLNEETTIELARVPHYEPELTIRPFAEDDIGEAMRLLEHTQRRCLVHCERDENIWRMQEETGWTGGSRFKGYAIERNGEMIAYFRLEENPKSSRITILEASEADEPSIRAMLGFTRERGEELSLGILASKDSHGSPLTERLVALGAVRNRPYAWQIRIVDHLALFEKMEPLLERRLAMSEHRRLTDVIDLNLYRFTIRMSFDGGEIERIERIEEGRGNEVRLNPYTLPQLVLGHRSIDELQAIYPDVFASTTRRPIIDALFPKATSYIHYCY